MRQRYLSSAIDKLSFSAGKMAFVSGPRQCGKTTLAKMLLKQRGAGAYFNWDDIEFRRLWAKSPKSCIPTGNARGRPLVVFDELHKAKSWKGSLKGIYDTLEAPADILATGSARLSVYRRGSDSLLGRYYHFRLHPFTFRELELSSPPDEPDACLGSIRSRSLASRPSFRGTFETLMEYGGFPEPFLAQDRRRWRLWLTNRHERIIREDLRDLSRIPELSRVEMLTALLPERAASPLSRTSLRELLEVSYDTISRWLDCLSELYYCFEIRPYSRAISRALRKERKLYLWDYSEVQEPSRRFENLVACHLLKACHYWRDCGEGTFELHYLRNKEQQELDFLITRDNKPWLPVEVKLSDAFLSPAWKRFLPLLGCPYGLQVVGEPGHWKTHELHGRSVLVASAHELLAYLA